MHRGRVFHATERSRKRPTRGRMSCSLAQGAFCYGQLGAPCIGASRGSRPYVPASATQVQRACVRWWLCKSAISYSVKRMQVSCVCLTRTQITFVCPWCACTGRPATGPEGRPLDRSMQGCWGSTCMSAS